MAAVGREETIGVLLDSRHLACTSLGRAGPIRTGQSGAPHKWYRDLKDQRITLCSSVITPLGSDERALRPTDSGRSHGAPAAGATLWFEDEREVDLFPGAWFESDLAGRFESGPLQPGRVFVRAWTDATTSERVAVDVASGGTAEVDLPEPGPKRRVPPADPRDIPQPDIRAHDFGLLKKGDGRRFGRLQVGETCQEQCAKKHSPCQGPTGP